MPNVRIKVTQKGKKISKSQVKKDVSEMTRKELSKEMQKMVNTANKRITRLEQQGLVSPAYNAVMEGGGRFSTRGKTLNQLRKEYARIQAFMQMSTATVSGAKTFTNKIDAMLGDTYSDTLKSKIFEAFRKVTSHFPPELNAYDSKNVLREIADTIVENIDLHDNTEEDLNMALEISIERAINKIVNTFMNGVDELQDAFMELN